MSNFVMKHCANDRKFTMHVTKNTMHAFHFIMSIVTSGVWLIVWILCAWANSTQATCTQCGVKN